MCCKIKCLIIGHLTWGRKKEPTFAVKYNCGHDQFTLCNDYKRKANLIDFFYSFAYKIVRTVPWALDSIVFNIQATGAMDRSMQFE